MYAWTIAYMAFQYADGRQLHLVMRADNTVDGLSVLATCILTSDCDTCKTTCNLSRQVRGTGRRNVISADASSTSMVNIVGVDLPVAQQMKVLGVILDRRLKHSMALAKSCNYHGQAMRHIRHLLMPESAIRRHVV